jgi:large repetitive protein
MKRRSLDIRALGALRLCFLLILVTFSAAAQTPPRISGKIDNSVRVRIQSVHPLVRVSTDQGPVEANLEMSRMILVLTAGEEADTHIRTFLDSQYTSDSPNYHRWLTPDNFGETFGPSPEDVLLIKTWLEQQGFTVSSVARSGLWMEFSGTASQVENAFQTQMHQYVLRGVTQIANATDVSIPTALAPVVRGVLSLNDFFKSVRPPRPLISLRTQTEGVTSPDVDLSNSNGVFHALGPGDFAAIFNLKPLYKDNENGSGITIAIVAASNIRISDVQTFRTIFSLPANNPIVILNGPDPGFIYNSTNNDAQEATLDAEWSGAVAPNATIDLVASASTTTSDGVDLSAAYIVDNNLADILSESFESCEVPGGSPEDSFYQNLWQQAAAQGISVFVSAGDGGAAGCQNFRQTSGPAQGPVAVNGYASPPFATAVGGTEFDENGNDSVFWGPNSGPQFTSALGYIPEMVWNESCDPTIVTTCSNNEYSLLAGGGGASMLYPKPSWQSLNVTGMPNDFKRDLPDLSLPAAAHDGYIVCFSGETDSTCIFEGGSNGTITSFSSPGIFHGTSASSPSFAGVMAIVDQKAGRRQGLANYVLYQLAAMESFTNCNSSVMTNPAVSSTCVFNDITEGNNSVPGVPGYSAITGYDLASGLGSVNATNLVNAWSAAAASFHGSQTSLAASVNGAPVTSIAVQHGHAVSVSATVKPVSGNGVPTGAIAFVTSQYTAAAFNPMASGILSDGTYQGSLSSLPGGQYNLMAHYPGDGTYAGSDSNSLAVSITPEGSSTTFNQATESSSYGTVLGILATVTGLSMQGTPTGQLNFADGGSPIASILLNSAGQGQLSSCGSGSQGVCLAVGAHTITASYPGDNSFGPSVTAQPVAVTITKGTPTVSLSTFPSGPTSSPAQLTINAGQSLTLQAKVQGTGPLLPTGTVQFLDGVTAIGQPAQLQQVSLGAVPIAGTQASLQVGTHTLSGHYSGDGTYTSLTSSAVTVTVSQPFQLSTANPSESISPGHGATYSITLRGNNSFSGTVSLACSGAPRNVSCTVTPNTIRLSSTLTSSDASVSVSLLSGQGLSLPYGHGITSSRTVLLVAGLFVLLLPGFWKRWRLRSAILILSFSIMAVSGCSTHTMVKTATYMFNVEATSGTATNSIPLTLTVVN